ncbi:MAG: 5'-methylthioadenosine/S-adenosylhomocysteine nucleosidase [Desulfobacterota bacterium]|nr:5'-methylthioadenosine/S-adenosylhomocysteine nucleosidase [Thermodesulfobacteriota bacterium]
MEKVHLPVIMIASAVEMHQTLKKMGNVRREACRGTIFFTGSLAGKDIILVRTGVGAQKAGSAARRILPRFMPLSVLIIGAAGALDPLLGIGDIVVAQNIALPGGEMFSCNDRITWQSVSVLSKAGLPVRSGTVLGVDGFVHRKDEKNALWGATGAEVIDMESGELARCLLTMRMPFVNIRIVSDTATRDTADLTTLFAYRKKYGAAWLLWFFLQRPGELIKTVRLVYDLRSLSVAIADIAELLVSHDVFSVR